MCLNKIGGQRREAGKTVGGAVRPIRAESAGWGGLESGSKNRQHSLPTGLLKHLPGDLGPRYLQREGGHGNPLQYSRLENPKDRRAWWATSRGVTQSQTQLSD